MRKLSTRLTPARERASTISAFGLAAAAALTLTSADARAQSGAPAPPPPGYEGQAAPGAAPPPGYYVPASVAQSGPRRINDWEEGEPIPPGYHPVSRIRKGLVIGGALTFGITYLLNVLIGAAVSDLGGKSALRLAIPVAGPFTLLSTGTASGDVFLVFDGLVQAAGVGMLVGGLAAPKTVLVRNDLAKGFDIKPTPLVMGNNGYGFGFTGSF